jgi:hypothetical protein
MLNAVQKLSLILLAFSRHIGNLVRARLVLFQSPGNPVTLRKIAIKYKNHSSTTNCRTSLVYKTIRGEDSSPDLVGLGLNYQTV